MTVWGASDIETWCGTHDCQASSYSYSWYNGYAAVTGHLYVDVGSATGCPTGGIGPACANGWNQGDYYNFSWGLKLAEVAPEIYNTNDSPEWHWISVYGQGSTGGAIQPRGPLDYHAIVSSALSATQAWSDLSAYFSGMPDSLEIHKE